MTCTSRSAFILFVVLLPRTSHAQESYYTPTDFKQIEKIDIHAHIHTEDVGFVRMAKQQRFRFVNMAVWSGAPEDNLDKHRTMFLQYGSDPNRTAPVSSFPLENWDDDDWAQQTIRYLDETFAKGAVGVKVWKNIGMELRDRTGQLVMIDDPKFDPIFEHLNRRGIVLLGHLGEPKNCWLPLDEMTTNNDRSYFEEHPKYHMYLHPEMPAYEEQVAARDRMLDKNRELSFLACHLGSLEWSVERMSAFLDRYPNASLGVAARMGQLQYQVQQDREQVREFLIRYQDRILYGTDTGIGPQHNLAQRFDYVHSKWLRDWQFFCTDETVNVPELDKPVMGVKLPTSVIDKIYRQNALRLFPNSWPDLR